MLDLLDELRSLLAALESEAIEFALCGGLAVAVHSHPRATLDIDLLVPESQVEAARGVAVRHGYAIDAGRIVIREGVIEIRRLSKPDPETGDLVSLDLLIVTPPLEAAWRSRERVAWAHGSLPVVSRAGLVAMKRLRASGQDLDDIRALGGEDEQA